MKAFIFRTKVFAISTLIFVNCLPAAAQSDSIYRIPAGQRIRVRMDTEINSKAASVNDTFIVRIADPVSNGGGVVLPAGLVIDGLVTEARPAGIAVSNGRLNVSFVRLRIDRDRAVPLEAKLARPLRAKSRTLFSFLTIAGSTAAGAVIGWATGSGKGAAVGTAAGAGTGTGVVLLSRGRELRIRTNEEFEIELNKDLILPVRDY